MKELLARYIQEHWKPLLLMTFIWILLELPAVYGHQSVFFYPLYYLTGALSGITGGGILGMIFGAIARAIIYVFFEQMIIILFFSKLPMSERLSSCKAILKNKLTGIIPYFKTLKDLISNDYTVLSAEAAGFGTALILSRLLSGSGLFRHSFVNLVLFIQIISFRTDLLFNKDAVQKTGQKGTGKRSSCKVPQHTGTGLWVRTFTANQTVRVLDRTCIPDHRCCSEGTLRQENKTMTEADRCILTEIRFSVIMELWNT